MMRSISTAPVLAAFFLLTCRAQASCVGVEPACQTLPQSAYRNVFERLTGTANGTNHQFHLSAVPTTQYPFHFFRNGIEMEPSADYELAGDVLTIVAKAPTAPGEIYQAAYVTAVAQQQGSRTLGRTEKASGASAILRTYLERSLVAEVGGPTSAAYNESQSLLPDADPEGSPDTERGTRPSKQPGAFQNRRPVPSRASVVPESMRMLAEALDRPTRRVDSAAGRKKGKHLAEKDTADDTALEGLGDSLVSSPFDVLDSRPGGLNAAFSTIDGNGNSGRSLVDTTAERHTAPSMQMLRALIQNSN